MSGQLRALKNRIRSVEGTKKITRAMEMVAASKLRRFQTMMSDAKPFTEELEETLSRLYDAQLSDLQENTGGHEKTPPVFHPFFEKREEKKKALVFITSDTGLCGSYNHDLIQRAKSFLKQEDPPPLLIGIGKQGINSLKAAGYEFSQTFTDIRASHIEAALSDFKNLLEQRFLDREVDSIYVIYSHFINAVTCEPVTEKILPLEAPEKTEASTGSNIPYIFEPSPETIFERLVPLYFEARARMVLLEAFVSEQIARMNAMHQATKNAREMIDALVLLRNKLRQAMITKELIEIVSGSQALKLK